MKATGFKVAKSRADGSAILARGPASYLPDHGTPPEWIMWMPGGTHQISASRGGKPVERVIHIHRGTAAVAQQALSEHLAASRQRPFIDFEHEDRTAAAWPMEFAWRDDPEPGVYVRLEWSRAGAEAVTGRNHRAFSPSFYADDGNPSEVTKLPLNMGGLTNQPAFRQIKPIWARHSHDTKSTMNKRLKLLSVLTAIHAAQSERAALSAETGKDNTDAIKAKDTLITAKLAEAETLQREIQAEESGGKGGDVTLEVLDARSAIEAKDAEIEALKAKVATADAETATRRKADADAAIEAAVTRGAIPPKDDALKAKWRATIERDPNAIALLASLSGAAALNPGRQTTGGQVLITREDTLAVLKAYASERDSSKRAAIYATDIRGRIEKDEYLPIHAASNTLGTLAGDIVTQRALDLLTQRFPMLARISTDFSAEPVKYGKKVQTRVITVPSVTSYHTTNGYVSASLTTTDVDVTINAHKFVQFDFNANELSGTTRNLFSETAPAMAYALGKDLVTALYALITAANFAETATICSAANFDRSAVIDLAAALNAREVPDFLRTLILNNTYYANLSKDPAIVSLAAYQQASVITQGRLPNVHGFEVFEATNLPSGENVVGFGFAPAALCMAVRLPVDYVNALPGVTGGGTSNVITEPNTGLSIHQVQFIDHQKGFAYSRLAWMYGVAAGHGKQGQRLLSAAIS